MAYPCDAQDGQQAALLITNLDNGNSLCACGAHAGYFIGQMAQAMDIDLPQPGAVTLEDLIGYAVDREAEINTIKATKPVLAGRQAELQTIMEHLAAIISLRSEGTVEGRDGVNPIDRPVIDDPPYGSDGATEANDEYLASTEHPEPVGADTGPY